MKKSLFSLCALLAAILTANAQTIKFDKPVHDFGDVAQKGGPVNYSFEFTNTGDTPLIIQNVTTSCGCTAPEWTKEPVPPQGRGFIKAIYTPSSPVSFDKSLTVSSSNNSPVTLRIRGKVVAAVASTEEYYPIAVGALRLRSNQLPLARILQGATKKDELEIINTGSSDISPTFAGAPAQLTVEAVPATLKAGEKGHIRCTYNSAVKQEWGTVKYPVTVNAGNARGKVTVSATIVQDFSKLTSADYENAPIASVNNATVNFGELKKGAGFTAEYEVTNTGKSDLVIYKADTENSALKVKVAPNTTVKPGAKINVKIELATKTETAGDKLYAVTLITNAPNQSTLPLMLTGKIN